jgi:hypothetical protein
MKREKKGEKKRMGSVNGPGPDDRRREAMR